MKLLDVDDEVKGPDARIAKKQLRSTFGAIRILLEDFGVAAGLPDTGEVQPLHEHLKVSVIPEYEVSFAERPSDANHLFAAQHILPEAWALPCPRV